MTVTISYSSCTDCRHLLSHNIEFPFWKPWFAGSTTATRWALRLRRRCTPIASQWPSVEGACTLCPTSCESLLWAVTPCLRSVSTTTSSVGRGPAPGAGSWHAWTSRERVSGVMKLWWSVSRRGGGVSGLRVQGFLHWAKLRDPAHVPVHVARAGPSELHRLSELLPVNDGSLSSWSAWYTCGLRKDHWNGWEYVWPPSTTQVEWLTGSGCLVAFTGRRDLFIVQLEDQLSPCSSLQEQIALGMIIFDCWKVYSCLSQEGYEHLIVPLYWSIQQWKKAKRKVPLWPQEELRRVPGLEHVPHSLLGPEHMLQYHIILPSRTSWLHCASIMLITICWAPSQLSSIHQWG